MTESTYIIASGFEDRIVAARKVTSDQILEVSGDLWGSADYGETAISLLESARQHAETVVWAVDRFPLPWQSDEIKRRPVAEPRSEQEMAEIVLDMWDQARYPFEPEISYKEQDASYPALTIARAGLMTRLRLADFSRGRGYDSHELHGTLGKAFDVLTVVSGVKKASDIGAAHVETEFVTLQEIRAHLRKIELRQYYKNEISSALLRAATSAIYKAKAPDYGEVIFEGTMSKPNGSGLKFERVAVSSLKAVASSFHKDRPTARALLGLVS